MTPTNETPEQAYARGVGDALHPSLRKTALLADILEFNLASLKRETHKDEESYDRARVSVIIQLLSCLRDHVGGPGSPTDRMRHVPSQSQDG